MPAASTGLRGPGALLGILLLVQVSASTARGDMTELEPGVPDPLEEGKILLEAGQHAEALGRFQQALEQSLRSDVQLQLARTYVKLQRPDQALAHYRRFQVLWERENPRAQPPEAAEVSRQVRELEQQVLLVEQAEKRLDLARPLEALELFQQALQLGQWSRIHQGLARAYHRLSLSQQALASLDVALGAWEQYLTRWRAEHPGVDAPDQPVALEQIERLRSLELRIRAAQNVTGTVPALQPVTAQAARAGPGPNPLWLALGISTAALVVGGETVAWVSFVEGNSTLASDPAIDTHRALNGVGHAVAAVSAVVSALSFYMYYSGSKDP